MSAKKAHSSDYKSISAPGNKNGAKGNGVASLKPLAKTSDSAEENSEVKNLNRNAAEVQNKPEIHSKETSSQTAPTYAEEQKIRKKEKQAQRDSLLISGERWMARNGHALTYVGLYLFSILVLFRPYELVPGLGFLSATAFYFAVATLLIFIPSQLATEGNFTAFPVEVKCVLAMTALALLTLPIAKSHSLAWESFNDTFIKAVLMFIVMVNVIRTRARLMGMIWLSLSIGVVLSYFALGMYMRGELRVEGYRVGEVIGGMFQNPNEMSIHLVMMLPLAITLGLASKNTLLKLVYFATAAILLAANFITFSRGGFLGLIASMGVLAWKLGRKDRLKVFVIGGAVTILTLLLAPGNFGLRVLSIFVPGLDAVGSSDQRRELLERSILVTLRNPWGIGIGNFPIVGVRNLVSHNAYTQVSAELGILGLIAYLIFLVNPFRRLGAIERTLFAENKHDWFYYLSIGLQSSIVAYMVSSFFASVAYNWFAYYLIAYAVAFRRIYQIENGLTEGIKSEPLKNIFGFNAARNNG